MNWYIKGVYAIGKMRFHYWWSLQGWKAKFEEAQPYDCKEAAESEVRDALSAYSGIQAETVQR